MGPVMSGACCGTPRALLRRGGCRIGADLIRSLFRARCADTFQRFFVSAPTPASRLSKLMTLGVLSAQLLHGSVKKLAERGMAAAAHVHVSFPSD